VRLLKALMILVLPLVPLAAKADTYLLMAEEVGCYWCAKWDSEIAHIYPKTEEGRAAPLRRYDLHSDKPDVTFSSKVRFTPTFILVHQGAEVGRIEGFPGEEFFWGLLNMMMDDADLTAQEQG
jgi:hypothetical protein